MKHLLLTLLVLFAALMPSSMAAYDFQVDGIYYEINGNEVTVTCEYLPDYFPNEYYQPSYYGEIIIPATVDYHGTTYPVTAIGNYAFYKCYLSNVSIPNSITSIGRNAFNDCIGLTSVTLPSTITSIEENAFEDCKDLKDVYSYITDLTNVSIGEGAFKLFRYTSNYSQRTLHVPNGTADAYQADNNWEPYFGTIVEMDPVNIPGDINGDGEVNIADFNALAYMLLEVNATIEDSPAADVNGDGKIDIDDIPAMIDKIVNFLQ